MKSELIEFIKIYTLLQIILLWPLYLMIFLSLNYFINKTSIDLIFLILLIIYYLLLIPLGILYIRYRDKKDSQKRMELRELEDRIFRKNIRK